VTTVTHRWPRSLRKILFIVFLLFLIYQKFQTVTLKKNDDGMV